MNARVSWIAAAIATATVIIVLALQYRGSQVLGQNADQAAQKKSTKKNASRQAVTGEVSQRAIPRGAPTAEFVKLLLEVAKAGSADVLSVGDSYDDFVSVAQGSDGSVYAAYAAYYNGHDQIRMHRRNEKGEWSVYSPVPLAGSRPDIWMPQLAVDSTDRVWVIWAEQTGQRPGKTGNWDLYARARDEGTWEPLVRLTKDPKPDINPHVATDSQGNIHVVWQAHPDNNGDIQYCHYDGKAWSKPLAVTSDEESDWYPRVAVDHSGTAWIAFDSYRNGDYDIFLTSVTDGMPGPLRRQSTTKRTPASPARGTEVSGSHGSRADSTGARTRATGFVNRTAIRARRSAARAAFTLRAGRTGCSPRRRR